MVYSYILLIYEYINMIVLIYFFYYIVMLLCIEVLKYIIMLFNKIIVLLCKPYFRSPPNAYSKLDYVNIFRNLRKLWKNMVFVHLFIY